MGNLRMVLTGTMFGRINQNIIHFRKDNLIWPADGTALANSIRDTFIGGPNGIRERLTTQQRWTLIEVYNLELPGEASVPLPINIQGARVGNQLQAFAQNCVLIRKLCFTAGRRGRGRMYFSGIDPATWNSGLMSSLEQTNWTATLGQLVAAYVGPPPNSGFTMLVNGQDEPADGGFDVVLLQLSTTAGNQRNRNIGVH